MKRDETDALTKGIVRAMRSGFTYREPHALLERLANMDPLTSAKSTHGYVARCAFCGALVCSDYPREHPAHAADCLWCETRKLLGLALPSPRVASKKPGG